MATSAAAASTTDITATAATARRVITVAVGRHANLQISLHKCLNGIICRAFHIRADSNTGLSQTVHRPITDILADDQCHRIIFHGSNYGFMSPTKGLNHSRIHNSTILHFI